MDEYRLNRIMEIALSLHRTLDDMKRIDLALKASDIYATAREIKEGAAEIEPLAKEEKALPEWCKVGEWGYDTAREEYFEIVAVTPFNVEVAYLDGEFTMVIGIPIFNGDCVQARKRKFNEKEMKALVGKVLKHRTGNYLVTAFNNRWNQVKIESTWRAREELKEFWTQLDGKPCYKLEHLENGEWVE